MDGSLLALQSAAGAGGNPSAGTQADSTRVEVGDIVLTKVAGNIYVHLVKAIEPAKRRVQIGNNRGGINGWTGFDRVYGIAVSVVGTERPGAMAKVVQQDTESHRWPSNQSGAGRYRRITRKEEDT